jgi:PAS domain-containing protein
MGNGTANEAAESLLPADLLDSSTQLILLKNPSPSLIVGRENGTVLWSSHEAARHLGFASGAELMQAGLPRLAAGTQRLTTLARGIAPDAPGRLERLRFSVGFMSQAMTAMCEPIRLADESLGLLVAFPIAGSARMEIREEASPGIPEIDSRPDIAKAAGEMTDPTERSIAPEWSRRPSEERKPLRFVFTLDEHGLVERVTPPLAEAVGNSGAAIVGRPLAAIIQFFDPGAAEAIRSAVLGGETWANIAVKWPVDGTDLIVPIELSALPLTDSEHGLTGFSGFGRCHLDKAERIASLPDPIMDQPQIELPLPLASEQSEPEPETIDQEENPESETGDDPDLISALEAFGALPGDITPDNDANPIPPKESSSQDEPPVLPKGENVVSLRVGQPLLPASSQHRPGLSMAERNAFREIARALGAKFDPDLADEMPLHDPRVTPESSRETGGNGQSAGNMTEPPLPSSSETETIAPSEGAGILDSLPIGILVLRGDEALFANRTLLDLTGYVDFRSFQAENGAQAIFRKSSLPRDRETGFDTVILTTREGEMMPVDAHMQMTDWQGGKATMISLRRASELEQGKALRSVALDLKRVRNEAMELRAVLDTATDGVVTLDEKGCILSLNSAAEALFGLDQNEIAGETFAALLHNDSHADALDYFEGFAPMACEACSMTAATYSVVKKRAAAFRFS